MKINLSFKYDNQEYSFNAYLDETDGFNPIRTPYNDIDECMELEDDIVELMFIDRQKRILFNTVVDIDIESCLDIKVFDADNVTDEPIELIDDYELSITF